MPKLRPPCSARLVLDLHRGEAVGGRAHQLEEDEHVVEVGSQGEPDHAGEEEQHQSVVVRLDGLEVAGAEEERDRHEAGGHECDAGADGVDDEHDADAVAGCGAQPVTQVTRRPPADASRSASRPASASVTAIAVPSTAARCRMRQVRSRTQAATIGPATASGTTVAAPPSNVTMRTDQPRSSFSSSGSIVPARSWIWMARANSIEVTVAETTMSVRVMACTNGSTTWSVGLEARAR